MRGGKKNTYTHSFHKDEDKTQAIYFSELFMSFSVSAIMT